MMLSNLESNNDHSLSQGDFCARVYPQGEQPWVKVQFATLTTPMVPLTWAEVLSYWQRNGQFQTLSTQVIAKRDYPALFWEMPPLTPAALDQPYECVLIQSNALARLRPNPAPFAQHFAQHIETSRSANPVTVFTNLGGDAELVVPCPAHPDTDYTHIAAFMRSAPLDQIHQLWTTLGQTIAANLANRGTKPLWVSTSGLGVAWLHIRLDSRPKYYQHRPYCR